jgi:hypothetical protein
MAIEVSIMIELVKACSRQAHEAERIEEHRTLPMVSVQGVAPGIRHSVH